MITKVTLPKKPGYLETLENGVPIYRRITNPLDSLHEKNKMLQAQLQASVDRSEFIEDCIAEMATVVYGGV